jgi:hypothetical protein
MTALLALAILSAADAPDWFRVYQYAAKPASLRGCSECQGEPDDVCELRAGAQARPLGEYMQQRAASPPERIQLMRSKADPACAVPVAAFFGARAPLDLAAVRLARAPPSATLLERFSPRSAVLGWPRAPQHRKGVQAVAALPDRAGLRTALVCWGSERGWPSSELGQGTSCEWWLLAVTSEGEPDLARSSFSLVPQFRYGDPRWVRAFDRSVPLEESILTGEGSARPETATGPPPPAPAPVAVRMPARCSGEGQVRTAVLDRFDQWEAQVVGARRSLDRSNFSLDAGAWSGHCQELDVLRSALEQQLGCSVGQEGRCVGAAGEDAR